MSLKAIKCKECGASIKYDNTKETVNCEYCGATYIVDRDKSNSVEIKEDLIKRGIEFLNIGELDNANTCFNKMLENDINDCTAYACKVLVENYRGSSDEKVIYYVNKVIENFDSNLPYEKENVIKLLNIPNANGLIPLHIAAYYALYDITKFLLEIGSDVNHRSRTSVTPLYMAACNSKQKQDAPKVVRLLLEYGADESIYHNDGTGVINSTTSQEVINVIKELRPNADLSIKDSESTSSACYVATAVYGSYDCPSVWTLRRYRDNILKSTWYGRAFIKVYYAISPTFVKMFGQTLWFNKFLKSKLDRLVKKLQDRGMESSPYKDIE